MGLTSPTSTTGQILKNGSAVISFDANNNATFAGNVAPTVNPTFRNRIINGDMSIDQRNAGASVTPTTGQYTLDRFKFILSQSSKLTTQQNQGSVTPPAGFNYYLGITSSSAYTVASGDYFILSQMIEGYNMADFNWGTANAKTVTLSFWVRSSLTGTFSGSLRNNNSDRSYVFSYTISAANTWEKETITIPGDTSGTWLTTNGIGIELSFSLGIGSTYTTSAGAWIAGNYANATGSTSVVGTNGATFQITGVQLEAGTVATPFEQLSYGTELALCQRYCFVYRPSTNFAPYLMAHGINTTSMRGLLKFPQTMRVAPSLTFTAANTFQWSYGNVATSIGLAEQGVDMSSVDIGSTGIVANGGYMITSANTTSSSIIGSAEL
jgi:hypothetical protein